MKTEDKQALFTVHKDVVIIDSLSHTLLLSYIHSHGHAHYFNLSGKEVRREFVKNLGQHLWSPLVSLHGVNRQGTCWLIEERELVGCLYRLRPRPWNLSSVAVTIDISSTHLQLSGLLLASACRGSGREGGVITM